MLTRSKYLLILLALVPFLLISCNNHEKEFISRKIVLKGVIKEEINDSLIKIEGRYFDPESNRTVSQGIFLRDLKNDSIYRTGWHTFYDSLGQKEARLRFYFTKNDDGYFQDISQIIVFDYKGDTIKSKSSYLFYNSNYNDTILLGDSLIVSFDIFHFENKHNKPDKYIIRTSNSQLDTVIEQYTKEPTFTYRYLPIDTGIIEIKMNILIFIPINNTDSLDFVFMDTNKKYFVK